MNKRQIDNISRFLSLVLRHHPEKIGLTLDEAGWAGVDDLRGKCAADGIVFSREDLQYVVDTNNKQRFAFSDDGRRIRASQGHSVEVDLQLEAREPPETLYHGTVDRFLDAIKAEGLKKMSRQHVHLSQDRATAENVGSRRGEAVVLTVRSGAMHNDGLIFYRSENGVWLTGAVPAKYIGYE